MLRRIAVAATTFAALLIPAGAHADGWTTYDRPAQYATVTDRDVPITMSDGVKLDSDVIRPDKHGRYPVLVEQTPYNKNVVDGSTAFGDTSYFAAARLRRRDRGRAGHRQLGGPVAVVRRSRAARRLRNGAVGGVAVVERRQGGSVRTVLHGPQPAADGGPAPGWLEGDLPGRADGGRLPRHHVFRRRDQHRLHPALARARDGHEPRAADVRARRQPGRPGASRHGARWARVRGGRLPAQHPAERRQRWRRGIRRAVLGDALADRGGGQGQRAHVRRRRAARPLPARRAAHLRASEEARERAPPGGAVDARRRLGGPGTAREWGARVAVADRAALVRPLPQGDGHPDRLDPEGHPVGVGGQPLRDPGRLARPAACAHARVPTQWQDAERLAAGDGRGARPVRSEPGDGRLHAEHIPMDRRPGRADSMHDGRPAQ